MAKIPSNQNDIDTIPLSFGKHKGRTPNQICGNDPRYIIWIFENIKPAPCSKDLYDCAQMEDADHSADEGDRWSIY